MATLTYLLMDLEGVVSSTQSGVTLNTQNPSGVTLNTQTPGGVTLNTQTGPSGVTLNTHRTVRCDVKYTKNCQV